jgi:hypothetical protein
MKTAEIIKQASAHLHTLPGHIFDVLTVAKPVSPEAALNLAKVVSKLSPLVGNMIEFNTCEFLNEQEEFKPLGKWRRQDPGFPDVVFDGTVKPTPGFEVKAWFPLATEITARFKDSQNHFLDDRTYVAMIAWLPEFVIFGRPKIIGVVIASGDSVAKARDKHYHNPPNYLVREPEETSNRTRNLQQTNTNGYKWQAHENAATERKRLEEIDALIRSWGKDGKTYSASADYQEKLKTLMGKFGNYRLDTNFAKMDRIGHDGIEAFATKVYRTDYHGMSIGDWNTLLSRGSDAEVRNVLAKKFDILDVDAERKLLK